MILPGPRIRLLVLLLGVPPAAAQERVLTTALEVRSLSPAEAESGIAVRLRGTVVFVDGINAIFVQDETSTTFFRVRTRPLPSVGDEIELTSKTRMGLYLPGLDFPVYRVIGRRPLPPGIPANYDDLYFGRFHYQRVSIDGVVRSIQPIAGQKSLIRLAMGSRVVEVRVETPPRADRPLVDHHVRITGLAAGLINTPRRQLVQPYLRVLDWSEVEVISPAPPAADVTQISAEELLAFRVNGPAERRVRIDGVVSASFAEEQVFLNQGSMAFAVRFSQPTGLSPGDRVTLVGFPSMERFSASVVDAELLAREPGEAPRPLDVDSLDALYGKPGEDHPGKYDGHLVRITAVARDSYRSEEGTTLLVQGGERSLQVRLSDGTPVPPPGSEVRLTGICQVESAIFGPGFASRPGLVSLRPTSPADVEVLRRSSWWTPRRLATGLAALAGLTLVAGLWIAMLRRQVRRQTAALRHRIEAEAALEERQRIAREFHDSLEQELAGVSLRLDALATRVADDKGKALVAASRNLVTRIQTETRDLISDLRDSAETAGDLATALAAVAARQTADTGVEVRFESPASLPELPPTTVHDLRMIARESVTNAIKHGRSTHVTISVETRADQLVMAIVDNGCGFDATTATEGKRGHFGCAGIRERGKKIGADVRWTSVLQKGATVEVTLPLARRRVPSESPASVSGGVPASTTV